jgi:hypothetical protein
MAPKTDHLVSLRAVRQLRQIRVFYAAGVLVWAASAGWTGWEDPGGRQMWVAALLLTVFAGLLAMASVWLRRLEQADGSRPAHHAGSQRATVPRHARLTPGH